MKTELAAIRRQLETLETFFAAHPMSAALAQRTHPGTIYYEDTVPAASVVIASGWTGPAAEEALAEAGELFGRDGWTRRKHALPTSRDFHWTKDVQGVRLSLLYVETGANLDGAEVPPEYFPRLQPASPAAPAAAITGANHAEDCKCEVVPCDDGMGYVCTKCAFHYPF